MIVGLGNPGAKYDGTKHNIGFDVVDQLLKNNKLQLTDQKFKADFTVWHRPQEKVILVKPFTYMNLSGEAVLPLMSYYGVSMEDLVVIYDDLDLEPGRIRLRKKGSSGGHNGMKSIISMLGDERFNRIRVGIGRPAPGWKVVDHVLAPFNNDDRVKVNGATDEAAKALEEWLDIDDFNQVMNDFNHR